MDTVTIVSCNGKMYITTTDNTTKQEIVSMLHNALAIAIIEQQKSKEEKNNDKCKYC